MANEVNITITGTNLSGPAFSSVLRDFAKLRAEAALLRSDLQGLGEIKIDVNSATASLIALRSKMQALGIADIADINVQPGRISTQLNLLRRLIDQAGISDILDVNIDRPQLTHQLQDLAHLTETIPISFRIGALPKIPTLGATQNISDHLSFGVSSSELSDLERARQDFHDLGIDVNVVSANLARFDSSLLGGTAQLGMARRAFQDMNISMDSVNSAFGMMNGSLLETYQRQNAENAAMADAARGTADLRNTMQDLSASIRDQNDRVLALTNRTSALIPLWQSGGGWLGFLTGHVQLFGGALTQIGIPAILGTASGLHLIIDSAIELAGTLIPATIAFVTFGAAAVPTVKDLFNLMSSTYTVTQAYGQQIYPLTGGFQAMAQAVQPEVYVLFGEALQVVNQKSGAFQALAVAAGKALDDLGARFVYAITQSSTFGNIMKNAANDLAGWGNLIGNIGGIIGNILKVLPGYAEVILNVLNSVTHALEMVTGSSAGQAILSIGLAAHGALLYIGLLATAATFLVTRGLVLIEGASASAAVGLLDMGGAAAVAGTGLAAVSDAAAGAAALPWGWILIAASALAFFAYKMANASDEVRTFNANVQQAIQNSSLNDVLNTINQGLYSTLNNLVKLQAQAQAMPVKAGAAYAELENQIAEYQGGVQSLGQEQILVRSRIDDLSHSLGGQTAAYAALNGAGITAAQITDTNKQHWAEALIEVQGYDAALRAATQTVGRLGAAQNALNFVAGDSANALGQMDSSMTKVTQAEDNLINTVIGSEQAVAEFGVALGGLQTDAKVSGSSLNSLNSQSLKLAGDFYTTAIPAAQKLIDTLQQQNISTGDLTKVIATEAKQLLVYAGNNDAAKAAIVALVNNALGPNTVSLQNLNKWVGNNSTSMTGFKAIVDKTTISAGNLANVLQGDLNAMFQQDILRASGAQQAMQAFTNALVHGGQQSSAFHGARQQLINDLINTGMSAQNATNYVDGLQRQINAMHGTSVNVNVSGSGSGGVQIVASGAAASGAGGIRFVNFARGGILGDALRSITGGIPGTDSVPFMGMPGEVVVPTWLVPLLAPMFKKYGLPGFAGGGIIGVENGLSGVMPYSSGHDLTGSDDAMYAGIQAAMTAAKNAVNAAAAAAATGSGTPGPGGGSPAANQALARSMMPGWSNGEMWVAWLSLWNQESGWNQYARNPSSGAYGIPQALPPSKMGAAANPPQSNPHAQISWGIGYIEGRYGNPYNAELHELAYHWYDNGGWLQPGLNLAVNGTGRPEWVPPPGSSGGPVQLEVTAAGASAFEQFMVQAIRHWVRIKGGGDVQKAFGRN